LLNAHGLGLKSIAAIEARPFLVSVVVRVHADEKVNVPEAEGEIVESHVRDAGVDGDVEALGECGDCCEGADEKVTFDVFR
jgi:hypothetical protein